MIELTRDGVSLSDADDRPPKVLLVDDNEPSRYALRRRLESESFAVVDVGDAASALAEVAAGSVPDLFILDVNLPDMLGFDLCRRFRETESVARVPVLQISATSIDAASQVAGLNAGADAYLVEPVDYRVLVATARALLRAARAERVAALRGREWQITFDAVGDPTCLLDPRGAITRANSAFGDLVGIPAAECLGLAFEDLVDPAGNAPSLRCFAALLATGVRQAREGEVRGRWHRLTLDAIRDESQGVVRVVASLFDLEDRRQVELQASKALATEREHLEATTSARQLLEAIVEQMPVAFAVAEAPSGRILVANRLVGRTLGRSLADGETARDLAYGSAVHADGRPYDPDEWPLMRTLTTGETIEGEAIEITRDDGGGAVISVSSGPVRNAEGDLLAAVATWSDVSARRDADALREAFISVLSHELRTPVTTIFGDAVMLANPERSFSASLRAEMLRDIADEAERLQQIVENLLVVARVERGLTTFEPEPLLLQHLIERVVRDEQGRWPDAQFRVVEAADLPAVSADAALLELVLRNLMSNAAKYASGGGPIEILTGIDGTGVSVRVQDRGPGLPQGEEAEVFRVFYRVKQTAASAPGAGIGLFVVRSLVEQMGGRVWARSRAGGGAEFGIWLPRFEE